MMTPSVPLLRSVLYVPASHEKALAKSGGLGCDAVIFDLEDAVAPDAKAVARERLRSHFEEHPNAAMTRTIRINGLDTPWGTEDLMAARACLPDAIVLPKVGCADDVRAIDDALAETDAPETIALWGMIETARGLMNAAGIAALASDPASRLAGLIVGTNDLIKETRIRDRDGSRQILEPWLLQIVAAGRAGGAFVLDGVHNDFRDGEGFAKQCARASDLGFDGKTLIHPSQIEAANAAFSPDEDELAMARRIVAAFSAAEPGTGIVVIDGQMVERLHLEQAKDLIARAGAPGGHR